MIPQINDYVYLFFKNGFQMEGNVEQWGNKVVLKTKNSNNILVIMDINQDLLAYKIDRDKEIKIDEIEEKFQNVVDTPVNMEDIPEKINNLTQLKLLLIDQEKKIVQNKLKEHTPSGVKVKYGIPDYSKLSIK